METERVTAPTDPDIAAIERGLSKAQREAVLALDRDEWRKWPETRLGEMLNGLGKYGLASLRDAGLAIKGPPWTLTPLGLRVRQYLQETARG